MLADGKYEWQNCVCLEFNSETESGCGCARCVIEVVCRSAHRTHTHARCWQPMLIAHGCHTAQMTILAMARLFGSHKMCVVCAVCHDAVLCVQLFRCAFSMPSSCVRFRLTPLTLRVQMALRFLVAFWTFRWENEILFKLYVGCELAHIHCIHKSIEALWPVATPHKRHSIIEDCAVAHATNNHFVSFHFHSYEQNTLLRVSTFPI